MDGSREVWQRLRLGLGKEYLASVEEQGEEDEH